MKPINFDYLVQWIGIIGAFVTYMHSAFATNKRVDRLEEQLFRELDSRDERLDRIEKKIDRLIEIHAKR